MNDFTKDELGSIFLDMNHNILKAGKNNVAPFYLKLRNKVESMIDNYCEHTETKQNSEVDYILCCSKCDAFKGWV